MHRHNGLPSVEINLQMRAFAGLEYCSLPRVRDECRGVAGFEALPSLRDLFSAGTVPRTYVRG